jgi:hypothetical protein
MLQALVRPVRHISLVSSTLVGGMPTCVIYTGSACLAGVIDTKEAVWNSCCFTYRWWWHWLGTKSVEYLIAGRGEILDGNNAIVRNVK